MITIPVTVSVAGMQLTLEMHPEDARNLLTDAIAKSELAFNNGVFPPPTASRKPKRTAATKPPARTKGTFKKEERKRGWSRLNAEQAEDIANLLIAKRHPQDIAEEFGCSRETIMNIAHGRTFKHVTGFTFYDDRDDTYHISSTHWYNRTNLGNVNKTGRACIERGLALFEQRREKNRKNMAKARDARIRNR